MVDLRIHFHFVRDLCLPKASSNSFLTQVSSSRGEFCLGSKVLANIILQAEKLPPKQSWALGSLSFGTCWWG